MSTNPNKQTFIIKGRDSVSQGTDLSFYAFSANNNNKKKFHIHRVSPDKSQEFEFSAAETLGVRELKNTAILIKFCNDNQDLLFKGRNLKDIDNDERVTASLNAREVLYFTGDRADKERRINLYDSFVRVSSMQCTHTINNEDGSTVISRKRQWLYDITTTDEYETIDVEVSVGFLKSNIITDRSFNLKKMMELSGRGVMLYHFMQSQRHKVFDIYGKAYAYNTVVDHEELIQALDLSEIALKRQSLLKIRKAFEQFSEKTGAFYEFQKEKKNWRKVIN